MNLEQIKYDLAHSAIFSVHTIDAARPARKGRLVKVARGEERLRKRGRLRERRGEAEAGGKAGGEGGRRRMRRRRRY